MRYFISEDVVFHISCADGTSANLTLMNNDIMVEDGDWLTFISSKTNVVLCQVNTWTGEAKFGHHQTYSGTIEEKDLTTLTPVHADVLRRLLTPRKSETSTTNIVKFSAIHYGLRHRKDGFIKFYDTSNGIGAMYADKEDSSTIPVMEAITMYLS